MINSKTCKKCNTKKFSESYHKDSHKKDGLRTECKDCANIRYRAYYEKNKATNVRRSREYYKNNNKKHLKTVSRYYYEVKDTFHYKNRKYKHYLGNKSSYIARMNLYRANKLKATPKWSELDKIKVLYSKSQWLSSITGLKYHIDHIIPIQGVNVCGLHVWHNLQIIEASLNIAKGNKVLDIRKGI